MIYFGRSAANMLAKCKQLEAIAKSGIKSGRGYVVTFFRFRQIWSKSIWLGHRKSNLNKKKCIFVSNIRETICSNKMNNSFLHFVFCRFKNESQPLRKKTTSGWLRVLFSFLCWLQTYQSQWSLEISSVSITGKFDSRTEIEQPKHENKLSTIIIAETVFYMNHIYNNIYLLMRILFEFARFVRYK